MTYHWTIGGIPCCCSPLTVDPRFSVKCAHETRQSADADVAAVREIYPDFEYEVVEGPCPQPDNVYDDEYRGGFAAGVEKAIEHAADPDDLRSRLVAAHVLPSEEEKAQAAEAEERRRAEAKRQTDANKKSIEAYRRDHQADKNERASWFGRPLRSE